MESISLFLNQPIVSKEKTPTSERAELIKYFVERVKDRKGKSYSPAFIGMKLSHVKVPDLYFLQKKCDGARNFSAMFWWSLRP